MKKKVSSILIWVGIGFFFLINCFMVLPVFLLTFLFDKDRKAANRVFMWMGPMIMSIIPGVKVQFSGLQNRPVDKPFIAIANHQSFLDMAVLSMLPWKMKWISKKELFWVPVIGWSMFMSGQVYLDRKRKDAIKMLDSVTPSLKRNYPVMIFPEGTRSRDGSLQRFKRGAFLLARENNALLLPMAVKGTHELLASDGWLIGRPEQITIDVLEPVDPAGFTTDEEVAEFCRNRILEALQRA